MLVPKIILANQNKVVVNGRHWLAQKTTVSVYTQGNLCIGTTFLIDTCKSYVEYTKVFNCVLTQGFLCRFVSWVLS